MIFDTHVHVISADRERYPMLENPPEWPVTTGKRLSSEMEAVGVERAMLVQSFFAYGFDNRYAIDCAAADPRRFQVVAVIDQLAPDAAATLETLVKRNGVRGVRLMPKGMPDGVLWDERTYALWEKAGELGIPITVAAEIQHHGRNLAGIVERFPQVRVAFEHMWGISIDPPPFASLAPVIDLARFPNVHLKLAPNNSHAARDAKVSPRALFDHLFAAFGIDRVMWGSNYPAHPAKFGVYADRLKIMQDDLSYLPEADQEAFFSRNAERLWAQFADLA